MLRKAKSFSDIPSVRCCCLELSNRFFVVLTFMVGTGSSVEGYVSLHKTSADAITKYATSSVDNLTNRIHRAASQPWFGSGLVTSEAIQRISWPSSDKLPSEALTERLSRAKRYLQELEQCVHTQQQVSHGSSMSGLMLARQAQALRVAQGAFSFSFETRTPNTLFLCSYCGAGDCEKCQINIVC